MADSDSIVKLGMLGAARIGREGLVRPARQVAGAQLYAVAARDRSRAQNYAQKHGIEVVHANYTDMLADPQIDAIYNPLPNGLHCEWTIKALEAGKHVLCEKPLAANADEARRMAEAARSCDRVLMEALHYRFHPLAAHMREALPRLGKIRRIETSMCLPLPLFRDIRYNYALGGGAAMDLGVYAVSLLRFLAAGSGEPALQAQPQVRAVRALLRGDKIDRAMKAELNWGDTATGQVHFSLWSSTLLNLSARVTGEHGEMRVRNPYVPQLRNRLELRLPEGRTVQRVEGETSYTCQLREFVRRIHGGGSHELLDLPDSIATQALIDRLYLGADLPLRGT